MAACAYSGHGPTHGARGVAMPFSQGRPTDELVIEAVREHVLRLGGPSWVPESVVINVRGVSSPITLPVPPAAPAPAAPAEPDGPDRAFKPSSFQDRILDALAGKLLTADGLAAAGVDRRKLYRPGGIRDLMAAGWVRKHEGGGYWMVDDPPAVFPGQET